MDRLTSMTVFVKAVELGSFAAAADALGLSAPMVGKHVRFLEERLGVRLINRTTRRQSVTAIGLEYYERCRLILAEAAAADALASAQLSEPRGKLRLTAPVHFGRRCVLPIVMGLVNRYPDLQLDLSLTDRLVDLAEEGFDLAVRTGITGDLAAVAGRRIARQRMIVCAAPSYIEANGAPGTVEDLKRHIGVVYRRAGIVPSWQFSAGDRTSLDVLPAYRIIMDDLAAIADAVAGGAGLAWLPSWLIREQLEAGMLVEVLPQLSGFSYDVHTLWPSTPAMLPKVRVVIDALASALPKFAAG
jgi:DNA-binding transcriptional LysR family regulator